MLSTKLNFVNKSATAKINDLILEKTQLGGTIINLSVGEPDFDTPKNIKTAASKAIEDGYTRYTSTGGLSELKAAVIKKFSTENCLNYQPNEIIVCSGGKQVIFNALQATINPEDEVLIPAPYWVSYPDMVTLCGGKPRIIQTSFKDGFKIKPEKLKKAINMKTKWLILNSPSNPAGVVYSRDELAAIGKILELFPTVHIMTDDIYDQILFENATSNNLLQVVPKLKNRTLLVNGVSKAYAMTGWRIGYGASNSTLIDGMITIQSQSTSSACTISQRAAIEALTGPQTFIEKNRLIYENRRNLMLTILRKSKLLKIIKPMGSFYALPSIQALIGRKSSNGILIKSDLEFASELLNHSGVAVVPGSSFGSRNTIRISFAVSESLLSTACNRIVHFANNLS